LFCGLVPFLQYKHHMHSWIHQLLLGHIFKLLAYDEHKNFVLFLVCTPFSRCLIFNFQNNLALLPPSSSTFYLLTYAKVFTIKSWCILFYLQKRSSTTTFAMTHVVQWSFLIERHKKVCTMMYNFMTNRSKKSCSVL